MNFDDETGVGIIGITDHAQEVLGDVVFVELPTVGTQVKQGGQPFSPSLMSIHSYSMWLRISEPIGAVESVKAASEIVSFTSQ